eukprot:4462018-Lingulodinium_polyedra.AAC.1
MPPKPLAPGPSSSAPPPDSRTGVGAAASGVLALPPLACWAGNGPAPRLRRACDWLVAGW